MDKKQVAEILDEIADMLELRGEIEFKVKAYRNASRVIRGLEGDLKELVDSGELAKIKGIGPNLFEKIKEIVNTGKLRYYEELKSLIPAGLFEMLRIPGLGPKRVKSIYEDLGISSVSELEYACKENRLVRLEGFGKTMQDRILKEIEKIKRNSEFHLISYASLVVKTLTDFVKLEIGDIDFMITGSWRRRREVIRDIDVVVKVDGGKVEGFKKTILKKFPHREVKSLRDDFISLVSDFGMQVDFIFADSESYVFKIFYTTGSKDFLAKFGEHLNRLGFKLSANGIFDGGKRLKFFSESEIFGMFGMVFIEPELREGLEEIDLALRGEIPKLVEEKDLMGVFHVHTTYSDGSDTLEDMVAECESLGFKFVGIADHSKSAYYAGGLTEDRLEHQWREIENLQRRYKIKILKGIEVDILPDGKLDYPDEVLSRFDFVIASIHSRFKMSEEEATERLIRAMRNQYVTMIGHPTGRLLLGRDGYPVDMGKVIDAAAKFRVAIEFNANPHRLDIDWRFIRYAREKGVKISINPDAHSIGEIYYTYLSLGTARKGMLTKEDVLNAMDVEKMQKFLLEKRISK